jgi:hypothetical protein
MGKLVISKELSDKISNSLRIKQSDIIDTGANKPIIRKVEHPIKDSPQRQPVPRDSPIKKKDSPKQPSPKYSPIKKRYEYYEYQRQPSPRDSPIKNSPITHPKKSNQSKKPDKVNYLKISKIVFISSIIGGIGITLGIKIGTILFL